MQTYPKFMVGLTICLMGAVWVKAATEAELEKTRVRLESVKNEYNKIFPISATTSLEKTGAFTQIYKISKIIEKLEKDEYPKSAIKTLFELKKNLDGKKIKMFPNVPYVDLYGEWIKGVEFFLDDPKDFNEDLSYVKKQQQNIDPKKLTTPLTEAITAYLNDAPKDIATLIDTQAYKNFIAINNDTFSKIPLTEKINQVKEIKPNDLKTHLTALKKTITDADNAKEADKMWKDEKAGEVVGSGKNILDGIELVVKDLESMKKQIDEEVKAPMENLMKTVKDFEKELETTKPFAFLNAINQEIATIRNFNNLTVALHNLATEKAS